MIILFRIDYVISHFALCRLYCFALRISHTRKRTRYSTIIIIIFFICKPKKPLPPSTQKAMAMDPSVFAHLFARIV